LSSQKQQPQAFDTKDPTTTTSPFTRVTVANGSTSAFSPIKAEKRHHNHQIVDNVKARITNKPQTRQIESSSSSNASKSMMTAKSSEMATSSSKNSVSRKVDSSSSTIAAAQAAQAVAAASGASNTTNGVDWKITLLDGTQTVELNMADEMGKQKKTHVCLFCGKIYNRKYGLKIHLRTHTGYRYFYSQSFKVTKTNILILIREQYRFFKFII
jgi:hypothetical protein